MASLINVGLILFLIVSSSNIFSQESKELIFIDNFENYTVNEQLVCQNPEDWTTWDNLPCTFQDPYITDSLAYSGIHSIIIVDSNDLVKPIDNYTEGRYRISFKMRVPEGYYGYFNTLQVFDGMNSHDGMQVFFMEGNAFIKCPTATDFNYTQNSWFDNKIIVDLDNDHAKYFYNNQLIDEWQWSHGGSFSGINQLGGSEFYPWTNNSQGVARFYIDDYQIEELEPLQLLPPENLTLDLSGIDIILNWESPFEDYWLHYDGENSGNGIGPGPVYTAARFLPEDIQDLDGWLLTKIKFIAKNNDCSYSLRIWTGENAGNLIFEYDVSEFIPDSWNEIELNNPILIDASQELWLGNICSSINAWDYPAACDDGPAIPYKGDLVSYDGINWVSMSLEYGLDYNWNIRGLVTENAKKEENTKELTQSKITPNRFVFKNIQADNIYTDNKNLLGYNVYYAISGGEFNLLDFTEDTSYVYENVEKGILYEFYVTSLFNEGESIPSDTVSVILTNMDENERTDILISPNPVTYILNIHTQSSLNTINIYDQYGKLVEIKENIHSNFYQLNTTNFNSGVYMLRIDTENSTYIERIIIK